MELATPSRKKSSATETETRESTDVGEGSETDRTTGLETKSSRKLSGSPNTNISIGCWNVRTLFQTRKIAQKRRRWRWLGHVCRMSSSAPPKTTLRWTPQGKRNRGRPKETWRRTVKKEMKDGSRGRGKQLNDRLKTEASGNPSWTPYVPPGTKWVSEWVSYDDCVKILCYFLATYISCKQKQLKK